MELRLGVPTPSLVRWGLSPDADLVYRALTMAGSATEPWLAKDLGMPARRVTVAIDELHAIGAVVRFAERRWRAVPAADVLTTLRRRPSRAVDTGSLARFHRAVLTGTALRGQGGARGRYLADRTGTRPRIAELVAAERHEHLSLNPERMFAPDAAALPLDRELRDRGIRVRMCGVPPTDGDASCGAAQELAAMGGEYRERDQVPLKLMVFDRRVALLPVDPLDLRSGALEIDQPAVVAALVLLFEQIWSTASDPRRTGVPPIVLTPRENAIVGLLAKGHTDAAVAQRLGISQRTIAYTLRALMDRLGVENRFQLGLTLGAMHVAAAPNPPHGEDE